MQYLKAFSISPSIHYTFASKASKEVANLTETQNLHTTVYGVKKFVYNLVHHQPGVQLRRSQTTEEALSKAH